MIFWHGVKHNLRAKSDRAAFLKENSYMVSAKSGKRAVNGYQDRKIKEIRNVVFGLQLWESFVRVKAKVGMFTIWTT